MRARNVQLAIEYAEKRRELLLGIVRRGINPRAEMLGGPGSRYDGDS